MVKAAAAGAVLVAAALPLAIAGPASAAATSAICTGASVCTSAINATPFTTPAGHATSTIYIGGTFAGTGTVTVSSPGFTFTTPTEVSGTEVTAVIAVPQGTASAFYPITVTDSGGTTTLANAFGVTNGPTVTSISPATYAKGSTVVPFTISGTNFVATPTIALVGSAATFAITSTTATAISGTLSLSTTADGVYPLSVTNPDGGSFTLASAFTVSGPTISSFSPSGVNAPSGTSVTTNVTVTGTGFVTGTSLSIPSTTGVTLGTTTVTNATTLVVPVTVTNAAVADAANTAITVTATNPDGTTAAGTFLINPSATTPAFTNTGTITVGAANVIVVAPNSAFSMTTGSVVTFAGTNITGTVTGPDSVTPTSWDVAVVAPKYQAAVTLAAATLASATSFVLSSCPNLSGGTNTVVISDGVNSQTVVGTLTLNTPSTGECTLGTITTVNGVSVANLGTITHAAGVSVYYAQVASASMSINNGSTTLTTASAITVTGPTDTVKASDNSTTLTTLAVGTWKTFLTEPGFGFTAGSTLTFTGTSGITAVVSSAAGNTAVATVTVPASTTGTVSTTLAAPVTSTEVSSAIQQVCLTSDTGLVGGSVITIAADSGFGNSDPLTVAANTDGTAQATATTAGAGPATAACGTVGSGVTGFAVNVTTAVKYAHTLTPTAVTYTASAAPSGAQNAVLTNGAGAVITFNPYFTVGGSITVTTPGTPTSIGVGALAFPLTLSGTGLAATDVVTSTNPSLTFTSVSSSGTTNLVVDVAVAAGAALGTAGLTVTNAAGTNGGTSTGAEIAIVAAPVVSSVSATPTLIWNGTSGTATTLILSGTGFEAGSTVAFTAGGKPDGGVVCTPGTITTTSISCGIATGPTAISGPQSAVVTNGVTKGVSVAFANALTVSGPTIASITPTVVPALTASVISATTAGLGASLTCLITAGSVGGSVTPPSCTVAYATGSSTMVNVTLGTNGTTGSDVLTLGSSTTGTVSIPFSIGTNPGTISGISPLSITVGSSNVAVTITGTGFVPGDTVSFATAGITATVTKVVPGAISATVSVASTVAASAQNLFTVTSPDGGTSVSGSVTGGVLSGVALTTTAGPTITSYSSVLSGKATVITITGSGFQTGAVVTASTAVATFGATTVATGGGSLTVTVTPIAFTGTASLYTDLTVTNPVGGGSVTEANGLAINPGPSVTGTYYVPASSNNAEVVIAGTGFQGGMTATSSSTDYKIILGQVGATSVDLLVTTDAAAIAGTSSTITFTNPDGGIATFTLNGGVAPSTSTDQPVVTSSTPLYVPTFSSGTVVTVSGAGFDTGLTAASNNSAYSVVVASVTPTVVTLVVSTTSGATSGTTAGITLINPNGKSATITLKGGPVPVPTPKISKLTGRVTTGRTVTVAVHGSDLGSLVRASSNARGTTVRVVRKSAGVIILHVTARTTSKRGVHTFTFSFSGGNVIRRNYSQH